MGLFNFFRNKKRSQSETSKPPVEGPTIFYHEDDYLQVEILPLENINQLKLESKEVEKFSEKHFDGLGYSDIYVRTDENKLGLKERHIKPAELETYLSVMEFDRITNVLTGYGQTHRELHKDCIAFGKNYTAIYYDFKENVIQHIWTTGHWSMNKKKLTHVLLNIGQHWNLVLQDWNLTITVDLRNKKAIEDYLNTYNS
jgi:hypothetical protein